MEKENKEKGRNKNFLIKLQGSNLWKYSRLITGSATFAFLLSISFFVYETIESKIENRKVINNLIEIQKSVTTRYLGLFPEYIRTTNMMLREALEKKEDFSTDTIIIFEDVLYYGVTSDPLGFIEVNDKLFQLADRGAKVFVVYYSINNALFIKNLRELLFSTKTYKKFTETHSLLKKRASEYQHERRQMVKFYQDTGFAKSPKYVEDSLTTFYFNDIIDKTTFETAHRRFRKASEAIIPFDVIAETILNERYFDSTRCENKGKFARNIGKYRRPIASNSMVNTSINRQSYLEVLEMCHMMDTIRSSFMNQHNDSIRFEDFVQMFSGFNDIIEKEYSYHRNITLIPITDYLTMSCWMIGNHIEGYRMIIAFPSRYSSDEIGFASRDDNIARYIHTMLEGIRSNYQPKVIK